MNKKIVIALGGNALGGTPEEQMENAKITAKSIVKIIKTGYDVVVSHGNGPQVGMIALAMHAGNVTESLPQMPFAECGAMSEGYIGYHLGRAISKELYINKIKKDCACIITEVEVDKNDEAFNNPTKPIGPFYTKEEADKITKEKGYVMVEDAKRGYRRVVPSPNPIKILELNAIKKLMNQNTVVIACGGGGIPVVLQKGGYAGIDAVIDKDMTSSLLAKNLDASTLLILTTVPKVCINYKTENEKEITQMTLKEAQEYIDNGEFAKGSMLPKVEACMKFVDRKDKTAIITSLDEALNALQGKNGTRITFD
ncbi:MAG: carbamate kinase [bacterium]|nr:carbamate kinase [bacterium]